MKGDSHPGERRTTQDLDSCRIRCVRRAKLSRLVLCTIPDDRRVLAEANASYGQVAALLDPLAVRFTGDHLRRDALGHLSAFSFTV